MICLENKSPIEIKQFVENEFKKIYPYDEKDGIVLFSLPDGSAMKVVLLGGDFNALVLDYISEDGDLYYFDDYDTPEKIFRAMLEETK